MTFLLTSVVVRMVVTHLRKPIEGVASGTRPWSTRPRSGTSSAYLRVAADSNQKRQVICPRSASLHRRRAGPPRLTSAANSAMLPRLLLTDSGIWKLEAILLPGLALFSVSKSPARFDR